MLFNAQHMKAAAMMHMVLQVTHKHAHARHVLLYDRTAARHFDLNMQCKAECTSQQRA